MKKRFRKMTAVLLVIIIVLLMIPFGIISVSAVSRTADEAISWCQSKVGQGIEYSVDEYRYQCVDFIQAYYSYLGVSPSWGSGYQYATNTLPEGWNRIQGGKPQKGDILVYTGGYGHVAICESDNVSYHQNWDGAYVQRVERYYGSSVWVQAEGVTKTYWGCIHPNFSNVIAGHNPEGYLESAVVSAPDKLTIKGWAYDKDDIKQNIYVDVYAFQKRIARITANKYREDVGKKYGVGNYHGFEETIKMPQIGTYNIAVYAINIESGKDTQIYYHSVTIPNFPQGQVESITASAPDCITIKGWAFDKDDINASVYIDIYAFRNRVARITADKLREDIGSKYSVGNYHGFEETIHMPKNGTYNIAVYAMNIGGGKETEIYYQSITVPNYPMGEIESVISENPNKLTIKGWAFDKDDINSSVYVDIYAFRKCVARITADKFREDIGNEYGVGDYHGFEETIEMPQSGTYNIAVYAMNIGDGKETNIYYDSVYVFGEEATPTVLKGDVNGDGKVTINDATLIQRSLVHLESIPESQLDAADINGDGYVTISDATLIQKYLAGYADPYGVNKAMK